MTDCVAFEKIQDELNEKNTYNELENKSNYEEEQAELENEILREELYKND